MKATFAVLDLPQFTAVWSDKPEAAPAPGRDLADLLLRRFRASGASNLPDQIVEVRGAWVFDFQCGKERYDVELMANPDSRFLNSWRVGISVGDHGLGSPLGAYRLLFGKREAKFDVPEVCLEVLGECIRRAFDSTKIKWITYDESNEIFLHLEPIGR